MNRVKLRNKFHNVSDIFQSVEINILSFQIINLELKFIKLVEISLFTSIEE